MLNLSLKAASTAAIPNDGAIVATFIVFEVKTTENRVKSAVRLKFQLSGTSVFPSISCLLSAKSAPAIDVVTTGEGSYHVTLPPSENKK